MNKNIIIDIDGTLCPLKQSNQEYADLIPFQPIVEQLWHYKSMGYKITLFTSRNMRSFENNIGKINKFTAPILWSWLEKWNIPYDELIFGKPWCDKFGFYVDDKAIRPDEFLNLSEAQIQQLIGNMK